MLAKWISRRIKSAASASVNRRWTRLNHRGMSAVIAALGAIAVGLSGGAFAQSSESQPTLVRFVNGRVLVQPRAGLSEQEFDKAIKEHGGARKGHLKQINVYVVELPANADTVAVAKALSKNPHFKFAELDIAHEAALTPTDPYYPNEWHASKINAPSAWNSSKGMGVTIAILDSGVDGSHPDLVGSLVPGWNIYDNNSDTRDVYGHGTKVAGAAAAIGNNGVGVAGIAFSAKLMPVRVSDTSGSALSSSLAQGLTWAADHGARVANMSYMGLSCSSTVLNGATYFRNKGGVVVGSGGNTGATVSCSGSDALTEVASTNSADARSSFSSYGPFIDLAAPGEGIYTTTMGGGYGAVSGTSFSAPITAGAYALMMATNPSLAPKTLDQIVFSTALDLGSAGWDQYYGWGRLDAAAAVAKAAQTTASDTQNPTVSISSPTGGQVSGLVPVNVSASDNVGVVRAELYANNTLVSTDTAAPYAFTWDTTPLPDGAATLQARAYDAAGNYASSSSISVTVANDTIAPKVTISSPISGAVVSGSVAIGVSATDNKKVSQISLLIDGKQVALSYGSTLSYTWSVSTTTTSRGKSKKQQTAIQSGTSHTITATAMDPAGNKGTASVTVTVQ